MAGRPTFLVLQNSSAKSQVLFQFFTASITDFSFVTRALGLAVVSRNTYSVSRPARTGFTAFPLPAYLPRSSFVTFSSYALQFRRVRPVCGLERSSRRAHQAAHLEKYRCRSRGVGTHCACGDARSPRRRRLRQRNACLGRHIASQTPRHHKDTRCEICIIAHRTKT